MRVALQLLKIENRNRLSLPVFEKREVVLAEIRDDVTGLIANVHVDDYEVCIRSKVWLLSLNAGKQQKQNRDYQRSFHQKLSLTVAVMERMAPALIGNPYC